MLLELLGAGARVRGLMAPYLSDSLELGRVSFAAQERYRIYLEHGEIEAAPAGALRWDGELPAAGDWVAARRADASLALIERVLPRASYFSRKQAGRTHEEQVLAANIDVAFLVAGLDGDYQPRRIERYLVLAAEGGVRPVVVLNKADLCAEVAAHVEEVRAIAAGAEIVALSAAESVEALRPLAAGRTVVLLGSSGAGKSTIANGLLGSKIATQPVRESDSRGRHTTTNRMLIPMPGGGALIDTPGMRELSLWAGEEALADAFADIAALEAGCRFGDCKHEGEPDCAVQAGVADGRIGAARWASFKKLRAEIRYHEIAADKNAQAAQKQKWKAIHKEMRHFTKNGRLP